MVIDPIYMVLTAVIFGISWLVGNRMKAKMKKYSEVPIGMTGKEIAEKMLRDNNIHDVQVVSVPGQLTDHYNPMNKTVNLSDWVYNQRTVAAAAVSAHEVGHAVQHATDYAWLDFRSKLVPVVNISAKFLNIVLIIGLGLMAAGQTPAIFLAGIALFGATTLFSFITLPVEFDASNRALAWLDNSRILAAQEHEQAKDGLKWAAMTYVVAALGSLAQLLYFVSLFLRARD